MFFLTTMSLQELENTRKPPIGLLFVSLKSLFLSPYVQVGMYVHKAAFSPVSIQNNGLISLAKTCDETTGEIYENSFRIDTLCGDWPVLEIHKEKPRVSRV